MWLQHRVRSAVQKGMSGVKVENVKSGETVLEISQNTEHIISGVLPAILVVVRLAVWLERNRKQSKSMAKTPFYIQTDIMSALRLKSGTGGLTSERHNAVCRLRVLQHEET